MNSNFKSALEFSLRWEGVYSNDTSDPGGETKYGISKRSYPDLDIVNLTLDDASKIYKRDYWDKMECDKYEAGLAIVLFDSAVNCGVGRTKKWLAELNTKANEVAGKRSDWMIDRRIRYYLDLVKAQPALSKYIKGWLNRANDLRKVVHGISI